MYFRDKTATIQDVKQHELWVALKQVLESSTARRQPGNAFYNVTLDQHAQDSRRPAVGIPQVSCPWLEARGQANTAAASCQLPAAGYTLTTTCR